MSNKLIDDYTKRTRAVGGMHLASIKDTYKTFAGKHEKPPIYYMAGDQSPSNLKKAIWVNFLNQDTPCLHGIEFYAKRFDIPLLMIDFQRVKRGYYEIFVSILEENPKDTETGELTQIYMKAVEDIILRKPENWLWSHKRWKHKR